VRQILFRAEEPDVMDAVQRERRKAYNYGYLRSNPQMVVTNGPYIAKWRSARFTLRACSLFVRGGMYKFVHDSMGGTRLHGTVNQHLSFWVKG
jgi:hypothetical protein